MPFQRSLKNKTILITGGAGAIGTQLVKRISPLCKRVVILDNLCSGYKWNIPEFDNVLFIEGDITSDVDLRRSFSEKPDIVFHLAAFFANQNSVDYPQRDLHTNGLGTLKLYEYSSLYGKLDRLVYASSGCSIYGNEEMPFVEEKTDFMNLTTPYQVTKGLGEIYGNYFRHNKGLPITYARFFNSYGPGEVPGQYRNVIPNFIYWAKIGKPLPITGTGEETRDFTFVEDIVDGLVQMATRPLELVAGQAFNLAASQEVKIIDLAKLINSVAGREGNILCKERRSWDTKSRLLASNEKAKRVLEFDPEKSKNLEKGIQLTFDWFDENWDKIVESADFKPGMSSAVR